MLQRVGMAQTLINDPELVFWMNLCPVWTPRTLPDAEIILSLKAQGKTVFSIATFYQM